MNLFGYAKHLTEEGDKMKKLYKQLATILFIMGMVISMPTFAYSEGFIRQGKVIDHYKMVIDRVPYQVEVCQKVTGQPGASSADVIVGAIIGGAVGNQIGKGKGNDAATILGAILGADIANKSKPGTTGSTQCFLETRYNETERNIYSHSVLHFEYAGRMYSVSFVRDGVNN
jgi:hypothetical protein